MAMHAGMTDVEFGRIGEEWITTAFGDSVSEPKMLECTHGGIGARLGLLVLHDDAANAYRYGPSRGLPAPQPGAFK